MQLMRMFCADAPVTIILASYNGAPFIGAQLRSIAAQSHRNWHVLLTDDGSTDETIARARAALPADRITICSGPRQGVAANFLSAFQSLNAPGSVRSYVAFCDQDDVWIPDKLQRAVAALQMCDAPAFYSAARIVTDRDLHPKGVQRRRSAGFARLACRSRVAGNTMVISPSACALLHRTWPSAPPAFHDWWATLVLVSAGAKWINDPEPALYYRQHGGNFLGAHGGRMSSLLDGTRIKWIAANLRALDTAQEVMTPIHQSQFRVLRRLFSRTDLRRACPAGMTDSDWHKELYWHAGWPQKVTDRGRSLQWTAPSGRRDAS